MRSLQNLALAPLIESRDGPHLSAYIANTGSLLMLKKQVRDAMKSAESFLAPVLPRQRIQQFITPLEKLLTDPQLLKSFKGNMALFRTEKSFRILNITMPIENLCVVATTFHVKPLLRWLQTEQDFLILGLQPGMATLYRGSMGGLQHVDSIVFPEVLNFSGSAEEDDEELKSGIHRSSAWEWIEERLNELPSKNRPRLYVAGPQGLAETVFENVKYHPMSKTLLSETFDRKNVGYLAKTIRRQMRDSAEHVLRQALVEYGWAESQRRAYRNIFQIARAAVQGRVEKLIVADGVNIFGKICKETGELTIHLSGMDHEDDDILDDIAQKVLMNGGQVIVAPREDLPRRRLALAIVDREEFPVEAQVGLETSDAKGFFERSVV